MTAHCFDQVSNPVSDFFGALEGIDVIAFVIADLAMKSVWFIFDTAGLSNPWPQAGVPEPTAELRT